MGWFFLKVRDTKVFFNYIITMRLYTLPILILALQACTKDRLVAVSGCGKSCYSGKAAQLNVGVCRSGLLECDEQGVAIRCADEILPSEEVCDGLDNNCDSRTDENLQPVPCANGCGTGHTHCLGESGWSQCTAPQPRPEVCDNKDNDCDGEVDEYLELPVSFCYSGPSNSLMMGACRPGVTRCVNGVNVCWGEYPPQDEICDGLDNDCDGQLDEGIPQLSVPVDLVLIVDNSCSMQPVILNVISATSSWVQKYSNRPEIQFALVAAPDNYFNNTEPTLVSNLGGPATLINSLSKQTGYTGNSAEPTLDALWEMTPSSQNPLRISWRSQATKALVLFSDEAPQTYKYMYTQKLSTNKVAAELQSTGLVTHIFTEQRFYSYWSVVPSSTGGTLNDIHQSAYDVEKALDLVIQKASCKP